MTCQKIREYFWEYQRRQLSGELMGSLDRHLRSCEACAAEFDQFQQIDQALESLPAIEPSPYFDQKLNASLADIPTSSARWGFLNPWWKDRYVWTFALLLLATVGLWLGFRHQQSRQLRTMEDALKVQDDFLGKKDALEMPQKAETAIHKKAPGLLAPAPEVQGTASESEEELIPESDLPVVENLDLLQDYEFLKKFDLADVSVEDSAGVRAN
jgi:Putative zinc-finger